MGSHDIMKIRKISTCIFAICLAAALTACTEIKETTTPAGTVTTTTSESVNTESTENTDDSDETEAVTEESEPEVSKQHIAIVSAVENVIASQEHAMMQEVVDPMILKEFFLIDTEDANFKEIVVYQCPISAMISEIIVIQAEDVDAAKTVLEARKTKLIEQDAFYPQDVENAEASIVDTCGNFAYFVINGTSSDDAELLNTLLKDLA